MTDNYYFSPYACAGVSTEKERHNDLVMNYSFNTPWQEHKQRR